MNKHGKLQLLVGSLILLSFSTLADKATSVYNSDAYMSFVHKGFLIQQTSKGWVVPQLPNRTKAGVVSPGPYSTKDIAERVIDRVLKESE
jgi:hypothetical protein